MTNISISDIQMIDSEPRVLDVMLAERLEFERPRAIRQIVERNLTELRDFGTCAPTRGTSAKVAPHGVANSEIIEEFPLNNPRKGSLREENANPGAQGGRPSKFYYLNEAQALLICMFSRTAKAAEVRKQIIEVFMAWRHNAAAPTPPETSTQAEKPIHVREHDRRTSTRIDKAMSLARSADRLEAIADRMGSQSVCAMMVDGEAVYVDTNDYRLHGELAAVMTWDGELTLQHVIERVDGRPGFAGRRSAWVQSSCTRSLDGVVVIGRIVGREPNEPAALENKPATGRKSIYRDTVVPLAREGLSTREIARQTGIRYGTGAALSLTGLRASRSRRAETVSVRGTPGGASVRRRHRISDGRTHDP